MNVLIVGNGAREHALAWKVSQSPGLGRLFAAPGNAGTAGMAQNLAIQAEDISSLVSAAQENNIDLVVIGPEAPLTEGLTDALDQAGIAAFGPRQGAAQIEGSKVFAKDLMFKYGIPCARSATFDVIDQAKDYVKNQTFPLVIKADGLAAGKGVIIADSVAKALEALDDMMTHKVFGPAGDRILVEECLAGREASLMAFTDGRSIVPMVPACDYKRAMDGNLGLNTGGMGSYSPSEFFTPELRHTVMETIMRPTIAAMAREGHPYKGVLYAGLMITAEGPKVLEFNVRFGDPETQVVLPLLQTDLVDIMRAVIDGKLADIAVEWTAETCVGVVLAAKGYPESYQKGFPVNGLDRVDSDVLTFHAGTKLDPAGHTVTSGGRVLTVVGTGSDYAGARQRAYENISRITFDGCWYRTDIGII